MLERFHPVPRRSSARAMAASVEDLRVLLNALQTAYGGEGLNSIFETIRAKDPATFDQFRSLANDSLPLVKAKLSKGKAKEKALQKSLQDASKKHEEEEKSILSRRDDSALQNKFNNDLFAWAATHSATASSQQIINCPIQPIGKANYFLFIFYLFCIYFVIRQYD